MSEGLDREAMRIFVEVREKERATTQRDCATRRHNYEVCGCRSIVNTGIGVVNGPIGRSWTLPEREIIDASPAQGRAASNSSSVRRGRRVRASARPRQGDVALACVVHVGVRTPQRARLRSDGCGQ